MIVYGSDVRPLDSPVISFSLDTRFAALAAAWLLRLWHFSTPLATHSRQRSGSSFTRDRPFILRVPRPLATSRSRSRDQRRSRIRLLTWWWWWCRRRRRLRRPRDRATHRPRASRRSAIAGEDLLSSNPTEHHLRRGLASSSLGWSRVAAVVASRSSAFPQSPDARPPRRFFLSPSLFLQTKFPS